MYSRLPGTSALAEVLLMCKRVTSRRDSWAREGRRGEGRGGRGEDARATLLSRAMNDLSLARRIIWPRINYTLLLKTKRARARAQDGGSAKCGNGIAGNRGAARIAIDLAKEVSGHTS